MQIYKTFRRKYIFETWVEASISQNAETDDNRKKKC